MADNGDPRFATPSWVGRYEVTPSAGVTFSNLSVMITKTNDCQLCGDVEGVTAGVAFATLPDACRPAHELRLPVCVTVAGTEVLEDQSSTGGLATLTIRSNGSIECSSGGTVHLDGFIYHICDRWY